MSGTSTTQLRFALGSSVAWLPQMMRLNPAGRLPEVRRGEQAAGGIPCPLGLQVGSCNRPDQRQGEH